MHARARGVEIFTYDIIVWFIFMYIVLLSVSVLFHSVLFDSCFDSVCRYAYVEICTPRARACMHIASP